MMMKNRIAELRKAQKMTQPQLAEKVGILYQALQAYEYGKQIPSVYTAIKIAHALNTTVEELFPVEDK